MGCISDEHGYYGVEVQNENIKFSKNDWLQKIMEKLYFYK